MTAYEKNFCTTEQVYTSIMEALSNRKGLSLVRIGDGETRAIGHNDLIGMSQIPPWMRYAGVDLPNEEVKKWLVTAIRNADIVGLPVEQYPCFKPLMLRIIRKYNLKFKQICNNRINYHLYQDRYLGKLIGGIKIILVGRKAGEAAPYFGRYANVTGIYDLPDISSLESTYRQILSNPDFELAIVAAGIPAVILCSRLAQLGKVALDMGHVIDRIISPGNNQEIYQEQELAQIMDKWLRENKG